LRSQRFAPGLKQRFEVAVSEDHGQSWSPVTVAGSTPGAATYSKVAFEYSRDGVLGLMWRAYYPDGTYDIWSSISRDHGKTFATRNGSHMHVRQEAIRSKPEAVEDDIQDLCMDKENIHMVWGDARAGFQGVFYGRVAISSFEFGH